MLGCPSLFNGLKAFSSGHLTRVEMASIVFEEDSLSKLLNTLLNVASHALRPSQYIHPH